MFEFWMTFPLRSETGGILAIFVVGVKALWVMEGRRLQGMVQDLVRRVFLVVLLVLGVGWVGVLRGMLRAGVSRKLRLLLVTRASILRYVVAVLLDVMLQPLFLVLLLDVRLSMEDDLA